MPAIIFTVGSVLLLWFGGLSWFQSVWLDAPKNGIENTLLPHSSEATSDSFIPLGGETLPLEVATDVTATLGDLSSSGTVDRVSSDVKRVASQFGVDASLIPTTVTPELESCLQSAIGSDRFQLIMAGDDTPTAIEITKGMSCL